MNDVARVRQLLTGLVKSTDSPVYAVCQEIVSYLEGNPTQHYLTVGGIRAALKRSEKNDADLIQAAFTLTAYPFQVLEVRYKLYDETISKVLEEITHHTYMQALSDKQFIDDEGNVIALEELNSRIFPYFINKLLTDSEVSSVVGSQL
ncbi:hypothetical protein O2V13_004351 [Vibrio parahaemolyticus]|uniref:hypothetical protein n=1 Tax=Vibrio harveyi group TaxID=717610 RepID=UPI0006B29B10|nr:MULTISPECIES: hypothetical protein [Vibrio harveyi group]EGQ9327737.1 hypothetical protein [Vibrio vulnificus]EHR1136421.1 hypothetical protein [Vibrio parahaemolyticus]EKG2489122.1 hypothetical protein [Vibrio parahaemolyticus]KOY39521.1 hypothetical protein ACX08_01075 [Vibrio parahaemolyticus]MCQ9070968.1 hypothetical protein [Vibrio alginolyticus]